jgi:hypothetical protein
VNSLSDVRAYFRVVVVVDGPGVESGCDDIIQVVAEIWTAFGCAKSRKLSRALMAQLSPRATRTACRSARAWHEMGEGKERTLPVKWRWRTVDGGG